MRVHRIGGAFLAAGAIAATAVTGPRGAAAQQEEAIVAVPARQVTVDLRPGRAYNQPQLVISPTDPNVMAIAGANYNSGECLAYASVDGGGTWRPGKGLARPQQYKTCVRLSAATAAIPHGRKAAAPGAVSG